MEEKPVKNSLLSGASLMGGGFSFEDAALLVPVDLGEDTTATENVDLSPSSDIGEDMEKQFLPSSSSGVELRPPPPSSAGSNHHHQGVGLNSSRSSPGLIMMGRSSEEKGVVGATNGTPAGMVPLYPPPPPTSSSNSSMLTGGPLGLGGGGPPLPQHSPGPDLQGIPSNATTPTSSVGVPVVPSIPLMTVPPVPQVPPTSDGPSGVKKGGNTFRLGNQRPMYAKYPGLESSTSPPPPPIMQYGPSPTTDGQRLPFFPPGPNPLPVRPKGWTRETDTVAIFQPEPTPPPTILDGHGQGQIDGFGQMNANPLGFEPISFGSPIPVPPATTTSYEMQHHQGRITPTNAPTTWPATPAIQPQPYAEYIPVRYHWFYRKDVDGRPNWRPFSILDSENLEKAFSEQKMGRIPTDGGRYDVDVYLRQRFPLYWEEPPSEVRRCSWFYNGPLETRFTPYEEDLADKLELEYYEGIRSGIWPRRLDDFADGEAIVLHSSSAIAHFCRAAAPDEWGNLPESQIRPRVVKRGIDDFEFEEGESPTIDHLVLVVHGIGAVCDFKFRNIVEAVDGFRSLSFQLMDSHFKEAYDSGRVGRVEYLPVAWHNALHGDSGLDQKMKRITLKSVPKLRDLTNDTLLDILFYTSPVYAQTIVDTVGNEMNRLYNLFRSRNPSFTGGVAVVGHSLGSLILFDLLAHQAPPTVSEGGEGGNEQKENLPVPAEGSEENLAKTSSESSEASARMVSYTVGSGTGQPLIKYPALQFEPTAFFALGSPVGMFVTVRGIDHLGENFHFPSCPAFFNIFHPYDPVAYRLEALIDPNFDLRPVLIPHHKGRKRFHLELKEQMQRVGADLKHKFLDSITKTISTVYQYATFSRGENLDQEIDRVIEGELANVNKDPGVQVETYGGSGDEFDKDVGLGKLNGGRRIDYVLQEAPHEIVNEYIFAFQSHVCYWESEDTTLTVLREIYATKGISVEKKSRKPSGGGGYGSSQIYQPQDPQQQITSSTSFPLQSSSSLDSTPTYYYNPASALPTPPEPLSSSVPDPNIQTPLFINPTAIGSTNHQPLTGPPPPSAPSSYTLSNDNKPTIVGGRPVVSLDALNSLRASVDPTAPMAPTSAVGPPPRIGFQPKK